jgi:Domain of unknown function (DUF4193)
MSKDDDIEEVEELEPEEFSEEDLEEEFDEEDLDEEFDPDALGDDDIVGDDDDLVDDLADDLVDDLVDEVDPNIVLTPNVAAVTEEEDFDDEEADPDDVEASLDDILKDRLVIEDNEVDEDEPVDVDDRGEGASVVVPKRPDEFVCQSCFLVKHPNQIADTVRQYCKDCV